MVIAVMFHRGQQGHPSSSQRSMEQRLIPWVLPFCLYPLPPSLSEGHLGSPLPGFHGCLSLILQSIFGGGPGSELK